MAKQPRQQIQDLQGYGDTATPSATPVDTYTGKIGMPSQSSAQQLADAIGSVANQGAKIVAQRKAEEKQEEEDLKYKRAKMYAQNFSPTKDNPSLDTSELQEQFPALKFSVLATIIEDKNKQAYYTATRKKLNSLPKEVRLDPERLQQAFNGLIVQASKETEGQDFVNAGALTGVREAYRALENEWASQTQLFAEGEHKNNFQGNVFNIFEGKDLSTPEGMQAAVEGIQAQETKHRGTDELEGTSPLGKKGDKQLWLDNLLTYAKNNPSKGQEVLDTVTKIKWLQDSNTKGWLKEAREEVTDLALADLELDQKRLGVQLKERKVDIEVEIDNLLVEGKRSDVRQLLSQTISSDSSDLDKLSGQYAKEYARVALARENADPEASNLRFNEIREDIKTASSTGDWSGMGFSEPPNNDQLRELIGKDAELTQQDAAVLRNTLSDLRKGFATISDEALAKDVSLKFALDLQYFNTDIPKSLLGSAGMSAQRVMEDAYNASMQEQFTAFYNNPNYETGVPEGDKLDDMKKTAFAEVEAVVTKLNTILTAEGNKIENLKGFNQELTQGEQPDIELEVGKEYPSPDGGFVRYLGGDPEDDSSFEKVEEEDPRYKVTKETEGVRNTNPRSKVRAEEKDEEAKASVANIFDKESATFNLADDTLATLDKLVKGRYKRKSSNPRSTGVRAVTEDDVMDIVLDQLGLAGISDFEYGGMFGDEADTAGEVAIKKIVDSLMEKHRGE